MCHQVQDSQREAVKDGVVVPLTVEDYCLKTTLKTSSKSLADSDDFMEDDMEFMEEN